MIPQETTYFPLPQDLLEEISRNLDIESFLSLRLTCRECYAASASLWLHFAREIQSKPQNPPSEELLEDYTPEELRHWVLRRHQVEQIWNMPSNPEFRVRPIDYSCEPIVLPGGRWFLSLNFRNGIMVADMDSPVLEQKVLLELGGNIHNEEYAKWLDRLTVWVDPREPRLTFMIAVSGSGTRNRDRLTYIYICRARLLGHGKDAVLIAEHFRRFEGMFFGYTSNEVLNDRYFIQLREDYWGGRDRLTIFDYETDCVITVNVPRVDSCKPTSIFFLPDGKVAVTDQNSIYVYAIPTSPKVSGSPWHPLRTIPRDTGVPLVPKITPYVGETSTIMIYLRQQGIVALIIPHGSDQSHEVVPIAEFPGNLSKLQTVGLFDTVTYQEDSGNFLDFLRYSWDPLSGDGVRGVKFSRCKFDVSCLELPSHITHLEFHSFHAAIGRLIILHPTDGEFIICDMIRTEEP